jgi:hypothetical protein
MVFAVKWVRCPGVVGVSTASSRRAVRPTELLDERAESEN